MIRDLCVGRTGSWSATGVLEIAAMVGYSPRKAVGLAAVKAAIGTGNKPPGRVPISVPISVPLSVPGTEFISVPREKEKEAKRKRDIYSPRDTSYLSGSHELDGIRIEVAAYLEYQAEKRGAQFTARSAAVAISAISKALAKHGPEFVVDALAKTIDKGADIGYFNAIAKSTTGSRGVAETRVSQATLFGSRPTSELHYFKPENGGVDYAAEIGKRVKKVGDAADD